MPLQLRKSIRSSAFRKSGVLAAGGCTDESSAWPETKGNFYSTILNTNITPTIYVIELLKIYFQLLEHKQP
jgi:hypothetical protein